MGGSYVRQIKSRWRTDAILQKMVNCHISATAGLSATKFFTLTHVDPLNRTHS